jgi:hypothetical protein
VQAVVVIQKTHHPHFMAVRHGGNQLAPGASGTVDKHLGASGLLQDALVLVTQPDAGKCSGCPHKQKKENGLDDANGAGNTGNTDGGKD